MSAVGRIQPLCYLARTNYPAKFEVSSPSHINLNTIGIKIGMAVLKIEYVDSQEVSIGRF